MTGRASARLADAYTSLRDELWHPPAAVAGAEADVYLLARHFGLSAREAMTRPAWEMDLLLEGLRVELEGGGDLDG